MAPSCFIQVGTKAIIPVDEAYRVGAQGDGVSKHMSIDTFLDVLLEMPDIEALQEIDLRKDRLAQDIQAMSNARQDADPKSSRGKAIGVQMLDANKDLSRLNLRRKEITMRLDRLDWAKAVTAIYGQEGFVACREWMAMNTDRRKVA